MSAHKFVLKATAFYVVPGLLVGIGVFAATILLGGIYDLMFGSGSRIGEVVASTFAAAGYAFMFGAIPALVSSFALGICLAAMPSLRRDRIRRIAVAFVLGWVATTFFLFLAFRSGANMSDWPQLRGPVLLGVVGGLSAAIAGYFDPFKGAARVA